MIDTMTAIAVIMAVAFGYAFIAGFLWTMLRKPARRFHPVRIVRTRGPRP